MVVVGYTVQLVYNDHSREPAIYGLYEQLSFTYRQKTKRLNKTNPIKDQEWIHVLHNDKQWSTEPNTENQKNEQDEPHQRPGMNSCAPQWQTMIYRTQHRKPKDWTRRTPSKARNEFMCPTMTNNPCSTSGSRRFTHPVICHEWEKKLYQPQNRLVLSKANPNVIYCTGNVWNSRVVINCKLCCSYSFRHIYLFTMHY